MKIKKLLALILSLCLLCGVLPFGAISANALTSGNYTYTVTDGKATITDVSTSISGNVTIPSTLGGYYVTSIGNYAFSFRTGLTSITIPDSVTSIGDDAFSYCTGLTSITIPDSVISIGERAFFSCSRLTSITIPDSVISIGDYAFYYCKKLTSITIPDSVTSIGNYAFSDCSGLTSITVDKRNLVYHSNGNYIIETNTKTLIAGCKNSVIPDDGSVTSIGDYAFSGCSGLTSITIPNSVTSIGDYAFSNCSGLTSIIIPDSVTSIGSSAFSDCSRLTSITIPDSVISIGDYAFYYCKKLTSITIGNSVTSIGDYAFSYCSGLTSITIPDSVTSISSSAFSYCTGLTSITVDKNNLVYHSNGNCIIETNTKTLIAGCKNSVIPADGSVTSIGDDAFSYCRGLTSITIPESVTSIGNSAFYYCDRLTSITIPDSVTSIGNSAFSDCSGLTSITIGNSVTSIGERAFNYCEKLTDIYYLGNKSDKEKITIGSNNAALTNATWHYITEWVLDLEPTCEENGIEITRCTVCGKKMERYPNALGHSFGEWEVDLEPTCTEDGIEIRKCNICGKKEQRAITAGHSFGEWEITKNPTCTEKGIETKICSVCGEIEEREVNILPHNFNIDFTPATCQSSGERVKICTDCNHKETSVIAGCHIYKNGKCVSCDITSEVVESKHNYDRNTNEVWTVTKKDANYLSVEFSSQTETESGYDFIYIYDKNDSLIGKYTGTELAGETITVTGDTVKIKLISDNSSQKYGFYATVTPISSNVIIGDTNGNGELDANDILNVRFSILSGKSTKAYDINGDGVVNVKDLIKIKKLIAEAV